MIQFYIIVKSSLLFRASSILLFDKRVFGLSGKNIKNRTPPIKAGMNGKANK
jgi:hypothetical protein